ncbi:hypothetical protein HMPREF0322_01023 [Desulfitobacterium hafniense DP7]|uniref:Uncharacterized protein n=1 Tax=Desulfitobacterium hafniense DP7 TaxID=537010 RepID=G9XJ97_DESHA|nr:hypothetical protein HMPREF0322_01023 [Desulfitobacterium hafniense DP7]
MVKRANKTVWTPYIAFWAYSIDDIAPSRKQLNIETQQKERACFHNEDMPFLRITKYKFFGDPPLLEYVETARMMA